MQLDILFDVAAFGGSFRMADFQFCRVYPSFGARYVR